MNPTDSWQRLAAAARRAPDDRDPAAPYGFAARVAAQAMAADHGPHSFFEHFSLRLSLRAFGAACLLALGTAGASYPALVKMFSEQTASVAAVAPDVSAALAPEPDAAAPAVAAPEAPAATPASSDDPVAELVNIVS